MFTRSPMVCRQCGQQSLPHCTAVPSVWNHMSSRQERYQRAWTQIVTSTQSPHFLQSSSPSEPPKPNISKTLKFGIENILSKSLDSDKVQLEGNPSLSNDYRPQRKRPWSRPVFNQLQRRGLEKRFQVQKYITKHDRYQLAAMLGLSETQVKVWFQNRRTKWRQDMKDVERKEDDTEEREDDDEGQVIKDNIKRI